jgi:multidrug transporter EmrE-like cation transporter
MLAARVLYGLATLLWVWTLRTMPLSHVYSFSSLGFVIVPLAAYSVFGEALSPKYAIGCALIVTGVIVTSA